MQLLRLHPLRIRPTEHSQDPATGRRTDPVADLSSAAGIEGPFIAKFIIGKLAENAWAVEGQTIGHYLRLLLSVGVLKQSFEFKNSNPRASIAATSHLTDTHWYP